MKYLCDHCGMSFDNEQECLSHEHEHNCAARCKEVDLPPRIRVIALTLYDNGLRKWDVSFVGSAEELDFDCPTLDEVYTDDGIAGELRVIRMASCEDEISEYEQKLQLLRYESELSTAYLEKERRALSLLEAEEAQLKAEHNLRQKKEEK